MNKIESRHRLIRSLVLEKKIHTQQELQDLLSANGVTVTQSTLSRDIKALNLVKVHEADVSYYIINSMAPSRWETLPGLAQSFGSILDALEFSEIVATVCGDDVCLIICEDNQKAQDCFNKLKQFAPPFFFSKD